MPTLNEYTATWPLNEQQVCVAADMESAARVLAAAKGSDPILLQNTKQNIQVELPALDTVFRTVISPEPAAVAGCIATPGAYQLPAGSKQIFTAGIAAGWAFSEWQIDGTAASSDAVALLTIPSSVTPVNVTAVFVAAP